LGVEGSTIIPSGHVAVGVVAEELVVNSFDGLRHGLGGERRGATAAPGGVVVGQVVAEGGNIAQLVVVVVGGGSIVGVIGDPAGSHRIGEPAQVVIGEGLRVGSGRAGGGHLADVAHFVIFIGEVRPGITAPGCPMLEGLEAEVAVAKAPPAQVSDRVVEISDVGSAVGSIEEGELSLCVGADVGDQVGAAVGEAVFPLVVKGVDGRLLQIAASFFE